MVTVEARTREQSSNKCKMQSRVVWLMYMFEGVVLKLLWGKSMNFINEGFQSFPLLVVHWRTSA